nr:hypothetical protein [Tanacetum cinerariifolium]
GEGPGTPTEPYHTPSPEAQQTSSTTHSSPILLPITTTPIPTITSFYTPHLRQYTRRARIAQSSALPPITDEPASPLRDVSQDMVSRFEAQELEIKSLKARIKLLEDKDKGVIERSGDNAPIKGRRLDVGEEVAERVSDDTKEMATVLTSMDATTVLSSGVVEVPTGSGSIPTAGPLAATATVVTPYTRRKGKEIMVESKTLKKKKVQEQIDAQVARELEEQLAREDQKMSEQIARDAEIARIHVEEELQIMIDGLDRSNETVAKYQDNYAKVHKYQSQQIKPLTKKQLKEFYTSVLRNQAGWKEKHFKEMTLDEIKENFDPVWKQIHDFIPIGSKEEAERFKMKGIRGFKSVMENSKGIPQHQIARDAEIARIHVEEELQIMIDGLDRSNETIAKYLQEYHQFATELPIERRIELIRDMVRYQDNYAKVHKYQSQQIKPLTKKQLKEFYTSVLRNQAGWKAKHFKEMTLDEIKENLDPVWKQIHDFILIGSKEEAERFKMKGIRFEQECVKKLKTSEEVKASEEVPEEKVKEMMQLVPNEEVYVEALQVKHPIIDWKHLDREDLNQLWRIVKEFLSIRSAAIEWNLYDTCGVHNVTSKDKEIFMLVEKDYSLRKGLAIVMICYKLQVKNYSQMASDLILKIHKIANRPRQEDD